MPSWIDNLRDKERQAKLAREMTHTTRAPIESLRGQDPLTDWALGMRERTLSPLATLAGEAKRFQGLTPQEMGMELVGGGLAGSLYKTAGVVNRGKELIQTEAENFAKRLKDAGVNAELQHSGSLAGPSSYIKVHGMPDIRFSGHSKGVRNSQEVINVATPEELDSVFNRAIKNQQQLNNQVNLMNQSYEDAAIPLRLSSADKKLAKGKKLTASEQEAVNYRLNNQLKQNKDEY